MKRVTYIKLVEEEIEGCWPGTDRLRFSAQVVKVSEPIVESSKQHLVDVSIVEGSLPWIRRHDRRSAIARLIMDIVEQEYMDKPEVQP